MTDVGVAPELSETDTDEPKVSHFVSKEDWMRGYLNGEPITALCGHVWVPTRDPQRYPRCPKCDEILKQINSGRRGDN